MDNPTYGLNGDGFDPRLPPIPLQPPPRRPRIPRNKHTTTSTSSSSSSSSPQLAYSAEYSVIRRRSSDLSPAQSLEDILEASEEEEREAELSDVMDAGYHVIKQENMDAAYMSEAGVSEEEEEEEGVEDERVRGTVTLPLTTSPDVES